MFTFDQTGFEKTFATFIAHIPNTLALIFDKNHVYHFVCGDLIQHYNFKKEDFVGKSVRDFIPEHEQPFYAEQYNRALQGEKRTYKTVINGRHYSHTVFPLTNENGEIHFAAIYSQDIHSLKTIEKELSAKVEQYNWIVEHSFAGFFDWDIVHDITYRSKRVWEMMEFEENELDPSFYSVVPYIHPDDYKWLQPLIKNLLNNYVLPKTVQYRVFTKTGKTKWFEAKMILIKDDTQTPVRMLATVFDITSQKNIEERILEKEQLFKVLFEQSYHIHYLLEVTGTIKEINNEALIMNVLDSKSQLSEPVWELPFFKQSDLSATDLKNFIQQAALGELVKFKIKTYDSYKIIDFSIKPIFHYKGHVNALMMEGREVTEIIEASEYAVENARVISLKNKQLEEFAHITSHNLRSPAVNTKMLLQLWQMSTVEAEKDMLLDKLKQSSDHLLNTIDTLALNLQIKEDKTLHKDRIYFPEIFERIQSLNSVILKQSNADVVHDFTQALFVDFPTLYMESVLQNLLTNAIKYASNKRKLLISLRSYHKNGRTFLDFTDNGIGMDLSQVEHKIFGLYKTFHGNTDARGVGLFITKTQMEAMGGKIDILSAPDKGTTFILQF